MGGIKSLRRRQLGLAGLALALPSAYTQPQDPPGAAFARQLRAGGCALLIRHALTEPGIGDPPGFTLDNCSSQRQISPAGRLQARRMGRWFADQGLRPSAVRSSLWCRCRDTADEAFGTHQPWPALNSSFAQPQSQPALTEQLRQALSLLQVGRFEVWITHQVNMSALTGAYPAMGEGLIVNREALLLGRHHWA
jgi:phosphohistidine phosphatase SixA